MRIARPLHAFYRIIWLCSGDVASACPAVATLTAGIRPRLILASFVVFQADGCEILWCANLGRYLFLTNREVTQLGAIVGLPGHSQTRRSSQRPEEPTYAWSPANGQEWVAHDAQTGTQ